MITIKNVQTLQGLAATLQIKSPHRFSIDFEGKLLALPALIDPHVHFRTPGAEHKENWISASQAAIAGGITTVFDMPNTSPSTVSRERLRLKEILIRDQLEEVGIPLRHHFYIGADRKHLEEIPLANQKAIGLKIYMGSSTGTLLVDDESTQAKAMRLAAKGEMIVAVHAECERTLNKRNEMFESVDNPAVHSKIRNVAAAERATAQAIELADKAGARLIVLHLSTAAELDLIREAKKAGQQVYCEVAPHHLFLDESMYERWGTLIKMNPPVRSKEDQEALWEGIADGTIDTIGSDHAPHTLDEKSKAYRKAPAGVPGIETTLPLMLNAHNEGRLSLERIVELMRTNIQKIYHLEENDDWVFIDLEKEKEVVVRELKTKCRWSPYAGMVLKGWPVYTCCQGELFEVNKLKVAPYATVS